MDIEVAWQRDKQASHKLNVYCLYHYDVKEKIYLFLPLYYVLYPKLSVLFNVQNKIDVRASLSYFFNSCF